MLDPRGLAIRIPAKLFESLAASIRTGDLVIVVLLESVVSGQGKV